MLPWLVSIAIAADAPADPVVTRAPELVGFVQAEYPESESGNAAAVTLEIAIAVDGSVEDAVVTESAGAAFDEAAVEAARQFTFTPGELDGVPAAMHILYRYEFVQRAEVPTTAIYIGLVRDAEIGTPVSGVVVTLADGRSAVTGEDGRFEFDDIAPGTLSVTLQAEYFSETATEETFTAGQRLEAIYDVTFDDGSSGDDDYVVVVEAAAFERQAVSTQISADDARKIPGTQGDVLKVVENFAGVARAGLGTGAIVVWGASPADTGVYVDGVRVPRLYHDGGLRSVVGSEFVKSVELVPGGYAASYGRGLGGLVSVATTRFDEVEGVHGAVAADLFDTSGSIHTTIGPRYDVGVAGRVGYVGPLLGTFYPDVEDSFPVPHYWDLQGRVGIDLRADERIDVTALFSSDATSRTALNPDPARTATQDDRLAFQRVYVRYRHELDNGDVVNGLIYTGSDQSSQVGTFGTIETSLSSNVLLGGARASLRSEIDDRFTIEAGVDAEVTRTLVERSGSIAIPPREGDVRVFGQPPPDQIGSDAFTVVAVDPAPYVQADITPIGNRLLISAGLRADPYARSISRAYPVVGKSPSNGLFAQDFSIEPRISARVEPTPATHVTLAYGQYGQTPAAADLSSAFGNPTLQAARGDHYVLGFGADPNDAVSIEATGFLTTTDGLAVRNAADQPARAEALSEDGSGRTYGAQITAKLDPVRKIGGFVSYTLSKSERRSAEGAKWRPSDYDQRHVLTVVGSATLPLDLELGVRTRLSTGYPRTEVIGAYYDGRRDLYQPVFGDHNQIRLPTFFQADVRISRGFDIGYTTLELSFEVQNVSNTQNVEEFVYSADYSERGAIVGLPILPVLGARWTF